MDKIEIKQKVKEGYAKVAKNSSSCCCGSSANLFNSNSCCGSSSLSADSIGQQIGYSDKEMSAVPDGANLGLGCGNPTALAGLKSGETVLDLGSGAGFDCFLAANKVGENGKVIGVDMTPEMIQKAKENAVKNNYKNVEFRLGEIEKLPVDDDTIDAVISNCVINLSPDKKQVFKETFRVLKKGGRIMVSDIVLLKELPCHVKNSVQAYISCVSGAVLKEDYIKSIKEAGFSDVKITEENVSSIEYMIKGFDNGNENLIASIKVSAVKP